MGVNQNTLFQVKHARSLPNISELSTVQTWQSKNPFMRSEIRRKSVKRQMSKRLSSIRKKVYSSLQNIRHKTREDTEEDNGTEKVKMEYSKASLQGKVSATPDLL